MTHRIERGDGWELHLSDCLAADALPALADKSIDHVMTDPPYAKAVYQNFRSNAGGGIRTNGRAYSDGGAMLTAAAMSAERIGSIDDILADCAVQFARVARRWVQVWSDYDSATLWKAELVAAGLEWRRTDSWAKTDPMPQITGDRPAQGTEVYTLCHAGKGSKWNGGGRTGCYIGGVCKGNERPDHPSPKPLWLMEACVRDFSVADETILDAFTGSGTTGIAAIRNGRKFIGYERDPAFFEVALRRLRAAREQRSLFQEAGT